MNNSFASLPANSVARKLVRYGLYPASWLLLLGGFHLIWTTPINPRLIWGTSTGILAVTYLVIEWLLPYKKRWSMSLRSFWADVKFAVINTGFVTGLSAGLALFTIHISGDLTGPAHSWRPQLQLLACLLIFEAINYSIHRAMHELHGPFGRWLWSTHSAHHLPPRLYLVMHAVFHPINGLIIQSCAIILPIWIMGYRQEVVTMFLMINGMHGLISHFNVDVRMGWLNYIFIGPELHRYHHSARIEESKNYGNTLSIYDVIFGTLVYRPGISPQDLGVMPEANLPNYEDTFAVLALPLKGTKI
jgi:sterol desaturase/sphingolipid hydroxylase (fatty acid hydroxylase superfamily)